MLEKCRWYLHCRTELQLYPLRLLSLSCWIYLIAHQPPLDPI